MKSRKRYFAAIFVICMILSVSLQVYAETDNKGTERSTQENTGKDQGKNTGGAEYTKNENVYVSLTADGTASDAYIVNHFSVENSGEIVDYGNYSEVKNLTTLDELTEKDNSVYFDAGKGEFYYQGQVKNVELPWKFTIGYMLDGKEVTADELAGKTGELEITFKSEKNSKADASFYDNYLMQVSVALDSEKAKNIMAEGATIADAGENRQLSFTILPGNDGEFVIKADVNDFTMSGFSIAAVPYSMVIDIDSFNTEDFTDQISDLTDAVDKLNEGAGNLSDGLDKLYDNNGSLLSGSEQIQKGLNELSNNSVSIVYASSKIEEALAAISAQLKNVDFSGMKQLAELPDGLLKLADALDNIQLGLNELEKNYIMAFSTLDQIISSDISMPTEAELGALSECVQDNDDAGNAYQKLIGAYQQLLSIKETYQSVKPVFEAIQTTLDGESGQSVAGGIETISSNLRNVAGALSEISQVDLAGQMTTLKNGLATLAAQYSEFHEGLTSYTGGIDTLAKNYGTFNYGISSYLDGTASVKNGALDLSNGMGQFADGIKDMPEQIKKTIEEMTEEFSGKDYKAVSFMDDKNKNISSVQFVISTEEIEKPKTEKIDEPEKKQGFFDRLKALFVD